MKKTKSTASIISLISIAIFLLNIEVTTMYVILHALGQAMHLSLTALPWIIMLYLLPFGGAIVLSGRLGDQFGHRRIFIIGLIIFAIASLFGGLSHHFDTLLIARFLQGLGASLIWPNATAVAFGSISEKNKALGIGIISGVVGFGLASGPIIGGLLTHYFSWRWVFLINTPIAILIAIITPFFVDNKEIIKQKKLDWLGAILLISTVATLVFTLNQIPGTAIMHSKLFYFFVAAIILITILIIQQKGSSSPFLPEVLIKHKNFIFSCLLRICSIMPLYMLLLIMGLYFQQNLHLDPLHAGFAFLPMTISIALISPIGGKLIDKFGPKQSLNYAAIFYLINFILLSIFIMHPSTKKLAFTLTFAGLGFAFYSPAALTIGMKAAPKAFKGAATGIFYMVSTLSGLTSAAIANTIIEHYSHGQTQLNTKIMIIIFLLSIGLTSISLIISTNIKPKIL